VTWKLGPYREESRLFRHPDTEEADKLASPGISTGFRETGRSADTSLRSSRYTKLLTAHRLKRLWRSWLSGIVPLRYSWLKALAKKTIAAISSCVAKRGAAGESWNWEIPLWPCLAGEACEKKNEESKYKLYFCAMSPLWNTLSMYRLHHIYQAATEAMYIFLQWPLCYNLCDRNMKWNDCLSCACEISETLNENYIWWEKQQREKVTVH